MAVLPAAAPLPPAGMTLKPLPTGQEHFDESCGGCHGLNGISARGQIPVLRDSVGAFLCSAEGRRYIVQLPNVAFAPMDDRTLAETMNYMVFELGGSSVPPGARPYSAAEVGSLRRSPLKNQPLAELRHRVLGDAARSCQSQPSAPIAASVSSR